MILYNERGRGKDRKLERELNLGELEVRRTGERNLWLHSILYAVALDLHNRRVLFHPSFDRHTHAYTFIPVEFNWQTPKHNFPKRRAAKFCNGTREKKRIFHQHLSFYLCSVGNKWNINISSGVENWWFPAISRTHRSTSCNWNF